jgi:hypothetical protein
VIDFPARSVCVKLAVIVVTAFICATTRDILSAFCADVGALASKAIGAANAKLKYLFILFFLLKLAICLS